MWELTANIASSFMASAKTRHTSDASSSEMTSTVLVRIELEVLSSASSVSLTATNWSESTVERMDRTIKPDKIADTKFPTR